MTSIENGPRRLSMKVTENVIVVVGEPAPGLAAPLSSDVMCPPPLSHETGAARLAAGTTRPRAIATTSEGTSEGASRRRGNWRARRDVSTQTDRSQDPASRRWAVGPVELGPNG
jgi:hypothetical protein